MLATWVIDLRGIDIGDKAADHREIAAGVLLCRAAQSLIARNIIAGLVNRCVQVLAALPRVEPSAHLLPFAGKERCAFDFAGAPLGRRGSIATKSCRPCRSRPWRNASATSVFGLIG